MKEKIRNPFLTTGYAGPDFFCDREEESSQLISALKNGRNITLISPRRMGKTGLIHHIFHQIKQENPKTPCFYMDIFPTKNLNGFVNTFSKTILGQLDTPSQKALNFMTSVFKSARLVFTTDDFTGKPEITLDFLPQQAETTMKEVFRLP